MSISSSSYAGQPPAYEGLLDNIKNANAIYEGQRQRILFLESAYLASQNQALQLEYAYFSCLNEVKEAEIIIEIMYQKENEYLGIIKQHKTKEIIYQTTIGAALSYIIYNLIFK